MPTLHEIPVELNEYAARFQNDSAVADCVFRSRRDSDDRQWLIAYVVGRAPLTQADLDRLKLLLPESDGFQTALVRISAVPYLTDGEVDEAALDQIAVLTPELVEAFERQLFDADGVAEGAVAVEQVSVSSPPLHLTDLLPQIRRKAASKEDASHAVEEVSEAVEAESPSVVVGPPLELPPDSPRNLGEVLARAVQLQSTLGITYLHADGSETSESYADLQKAAFRTLNGLRQQGVAVGDKVLLQVVRNDEFVRVFWACQLGGFVPVPLSLPPSYDQPSSHVDKLRNCWELLEHPVVVASDHLADAIRQGTAIPNDADLKVLGVGELEQDTDATEYAEVDPDDVALLLFTSGSTGLPKGVPLTHANLISRSFATIQHNSFHERDVSLNWFPLDHVGGLVMFHLRDVVCCCRQLQVATELVLADPLTWFDIVHREKVSITWAPNFAFALINDRAEDVRQRIWDLSSLRFILNGGESIVPRTARRFLSLLTPYGLSATAMHPAWGMSETCSGVTFSSRFTLELTSDDDPYTEVGVPIPGFSMRVVDPEHRPVPMGTVGSLQVQGLSVTAGYYRNPEVNAASYTADGWFITGDLSVIRAGRLSITGREKDVVIVNGANFNCHELEATVDDVEGVAVSYSAACAVRSPESDTDELAIFFSPEVPDQELPTELLGRIRAAIVNKFSLSPSFMIPVPKERIPKTSIGKIQRSQLREAFQSGEFDAICKQLDIAAGNARTIPDWFFERRWIQAAPPATVVQSLSQPVLVFLDDRGLGEQLCAALEAAGADVVQAVPGPKFAQLSKRKYQVDVNDVESFRLLLLQSTDAGDRSPVASERFPIRRFVDLWNYGCSGEAESLEVLDSQFERSLVSLTHLSIALKTLDMFADETTYELVAVSSRAQRVDDHEPVASHCSPLLGALRSIPRQLPRLKVRMIDLEPEVQGAVAQLLDELERTPRDSEVAYRGGSRLIPRLHRVDFSDPPQPLPLRAGGMYLLTGGFTGIGRIVAEYLLEAQQANLLIIGRTEIPDLENAQLLDQPNDPHLERRKAFHQLRQLGGTVAYTGVDVTDRSGLERTIDHWQDQWDCRLDGVFHLAGVLQEKLLTEETGESLRDALKAKVHGTWTLGQVLQAYPDALCVTFSSLNAFFGGATMAAYAAANCYLEGFVQNQRLSGREHSYCIHWGMWKGIGLAAGYQSEDLSRASGYFTLGPNQGLNSLLIAMSHQQANLLVGLDAGNLAIRSQLEEPTRAVESLQAYCTRASEEDGLAQPPLDNLTGRDPFGAEVSCPVECIEELPRTATGEIDREQLTKLRLLSHGTHVIPRNQIEQQVAEIWQQILRLPRVGANDNFFALGGNSLLAISLFREIERKFHKRLPLSTMFQGATVEHLARAIADEDVATEQIQIVPIHPGTGHPPLLAVHSVGGELFEYQPLTKYLSPEVSLLGITPIFVDGIPILFDSMEEMAEHYTSLLCETVPEGPYCLLGYSYAGMLAYEMARELTARGKEVGFLGIVDTGPNWSRRKKKFAAFYGLADLGLGVWYMLKDEFFPAPFMEKIDWPRKILGRAVQFARNPTPETAWRIFLDSMFKYDSLPEHYQQLINVQLRLFFRYTPKPYSGRLTLYKAKVVQFGADLGDDIGWGDVVSGGVDIVQVSGQHGNAMRAQYVEILAHDVNERLRALNTGPRK